MENLKIVKLTKNNIKHIYVKNVVKKSYRHSFCVAAFILTFTLGVLNITGLTELNSAMQSVYNPINSLFNKGGDVIFTSTGTSEADLNFVLPLISKNVDCSNGKIEIVAEDYLVVSSPETGFVSQIGTLTSGESFIEIMHSETLVSQIVNIDVSGVVVGQKVDKNQNIGTIKNGEMLTFNLLNNQKPIELNFVNGTIEWKNFQ